MRIVALMTLAFSLSACGFEVVDTGYRGIKTNMGEVQEHSLPEGFYTYNPITSDIVQMDIRTQRAELETVAYTKDVQQAKIRYVVNYNLSPTNAHIVYREVGTGWENSLIPQVLEGVLKTQVGKWDAVELISNRDKATVTIFTLVAQALAEKNIVVSNFELTNISYQPEFEKAVEAKVTAVQRAEEAKNTTVRIREEAEQKIISAKAEAESMRIRANALSQNATLVEYEAVQKWDGKLPQYMLGNATPFINVTK